jgi:hypothetical protein
VPSPRRRSTRAKGSDTLLVYAQIVTYGGSQSKLFDDEITQESFK